MRLTPSEQLAACDALIDLLTAKIISYLTPENVVDEIFGDPPLHVPLPIPNHYSADNQTSPAGIIDIGVEIIRENRGNGYICSQLQRKLEEAATGGSSVNSVAFSACFSGLYR